MKIAFCSAVSFGTLGSPGTYKFVEKCREYFDIIVFAPLNKKNTVFKDSAIPVIPIKSLQSKEYIDTIIHGLHAFDPDIVYIFNYPSWPGLLGFLKKEFPDKKFILDLKSPLLAEGKKREEIQKNGMPAQDNLDAIVTLAKENVPTWIPDCSLDPFVYPLGIDLSLFHAPSAMDRAHCLKFVYIGVIHEKRQLDLLIGIFHTFVTRKSTNACLDIYGAGPDQERLQEKISSLSHGNQIRLCGLVPQKELIQKLADYDAGIAWVPYEEYDTSPSLKAIEYMAAGLPIMASDTTAHRLLEKQGCSIDFFGNNESALLNGLVNISANGFSNERIKQNLDAVKVCDYHHIIQHYFEPFFKKLIKKKTAPDTEPIPSKSQPLLYVGPSAFRPGIWETRAAYILPDLFNAVPDQFQIHLLTAPVPEFAKESLENLCQRYDIQHHEAGEKPDHISAYEYWRTEILSVSRQINPCALTNIFGPVTLGAAMGFAGRETFARIILRVAGDEIDSRISMGIYGKTIERLDVDTAHQAMGFQLADTIIAMSPLEKERICKDLPQNQWDKVIVSIRGIDISRFAGTCKNYLSEPVQNFLYVGRKSLEKGYDILEAVADLTFEQNPNIRFTFAGSFEPEKTKNRDYIGWVDSKDLSKTFAQTDAYIMTSRSEGFPQVAAEAMATGLPCILPEHLFRNLLTHEKEA
ncbi:MAG: glycosyltransferase, partial [Desulfobacteraceae bacterium]|nr:glycosyltransferase [Desulfobacteraceae bacterium]